MKKLFLFVVCSTSVQSFAMEDPKHCLITDAINTMYGKLNRLNDIEELRKLSKDWHYYCKEQIDSTSDSSIESKLKESIVSMNSTVINKLYFIGLYRTTIKFINYVFSIQSNNDLFPRLTIIKKACEQALEKNKSKKCNNKRKRPLQPSYIMPIVNKRQKVERDTRKEKKIEKINQKLIRFVESLNEDIYDKIKENKKKLQHEDLCKYMMETYKDIEKYMINFNDFEYDRLETKVLNNFCQATRLLLRWYLNSDNETILKKAISLVTFGCNIPFRCTNNKPRSVIFYSLNKLSNKLSECNKLFVEEKTKND